MNKKIGILAAILLCGILPAVSFADLITIGLTGKISQVDDPRNVFGGQIHFNDTITGTYTYDTLTPDSESSNSSGVYWHYNAPCGVSITIGSFNFKTDSDNVQFKVGIINNGFSGEDVYDFHSYNNLPLSNGALVEGIAWQIEDSTGLAFSNDALPTTAPNLDDWNEDLGLTINGPGHDGFLLRADITSVVLIPEPVTFLFFILGSTFLKRR